MNLKEMNEYILNTRPVFVPPSLLPFWLLSYTLENSLFLVDLT
jgi:hypothetical protein